MDGKGGARMRTEDILYACERIAGISAVPVRVYEGGALVGSFLLDDWPADPIAPYLPRMLARAEAVSYDATPFGQHYGAIRHGRVRVLVGPVGLGRYSRQEKADYAFALGVDEKGFARVYERMKAIPAYPVENFLHMLLMINFFLNGEKLTLRDVAPYLLVQDGAEPLLPGVEADRGEDQAPSVHSALAYERRMTGLIRAGDEGGLEAFLTREIHGSVGTLAGDPLRHHKNLLVVTATLAARAAIEGGLNENEAMEMSDAYIRRGEALFSPDAILGLLYRMALDYAARVARERDAPPMSALLAEVASYVRRNLSAPLDAETLARRFHVSRSHLDARFKKEAGVTTAQFVRGERLRRACVLLASTDRPLSEIAAHLRFSSQSHFQTRFREMYGMTPAEYRRREARPSP